MAARGGHVGPVSLVLATRSVHKLREVHEIMRDVDLLPPFILETPPEPAAPNEDGIERYASFQENAAAKAVYFAHCTGTLALADDSGLCVDALNGAPGVRSKRLAHDHGVATDPVDAANNSLLLLLLKDVRAEQRGAGYVCAIAVASPSGVVATATGSCRGMILTAPEGVGGFGYDPLFYVPEEEATFATLSPSRKNHISHRARALRALAPQLRRLSGEAPPNLTRRT